MTSPAVSERDLAVLRSFARRIDPSDAGAHNNLGVLYYQKGLVPEAIEQFTRALELDPKMQVAQRNLEIAYHNTGFYDRRVAELQERLNAEKEHVVHHLGQIEIGEQELGAVKSALALQKQTNETLQRLSLLHLHVTAVAECFTAC